MTEQQSVNPSYEELRDTCPDRSIREKWIAADQRVEHARRALEDVQNDGRFSEEGKAERAQQIIDRNAEAIARAYDEARESANVSAENAYRASIPMPDHGNYQFDRIKDAQELIASQNETMRLVTLAEARRGKAQMKGSSDSGEGMKLRSDPRLDVLREAYGEALKGDDDVARIKAHAAIEAAEALGIGVEDLVAPFRQEKHYRYLEESRQMDRVYRTIPSGKSYAPDTSPFKATGKQRQTGVGTYRGKNTAVVGGGKLTMTHKKPRHW
jgi:hypothetical protein